MKTQYAEALVLLKQKMERILTLHQQALAENESLKQQVEQLSLELTNYKNVKDTLETKIQKLQLAGAFHASSEDAKEAKLKLGKLIKEIDKCLAMLNR